MSQIKLLQGDCLDKLKELGENSIDSIVTDPPYGLSFMGKAWDYDVPKKEIWEECLRVLKPGGHLLAFAGTRTQHRMAVNIEDAGFEIRDMIAWVYGSGFPKSLNIGKAVDKIQGNEREVLGTRKVPDQRSGGINSERTAQMGVPTRMTTDTKGTSEWEGWGTALKPALEPITVARKPISEKNIAENVLKWGTGGINIDGCRVEATEFAQDKGTKRPQSDDYIFKSFDENTRPSGSGATSILGRFPANLIHDGSEEVVELFPNTKSGKMTPAHTRHTDGSPNGIYGKFDENHPLAETYGDSGSASRFFKNCPFTEEETAQRFLYQAKASKSERNAGLEGFEEKQNRFMATANGTGETSKGMDRFSTLPKANFHPTVKPIALMEYLVKLVSREGAVVLDPFMGSGSTGIACKKLDRQFIGIELEEEYIKIAKARIAHWTNQSNLL